MTALGRWTSVDPPADSFPSWSPYNYVFNNPAILIDPFGLAATASCHPRCGSLRSTGALVGGTLGAVIGGTGGAVAGTVILPVAGTFGAGAAGALVGSVEGAAIGITVAGIAEEIADLAASAYKVSRTGAKRIAGRALEFITSLMLNVTPPTPPNKDPDDRVKEGPPPVEQVHDGSAGK
jgi:hypothetical protein